MTRAIAPFFGLLLLLWPWPMAVAADKSSVAHNDDRYWSPLGSGMNASISRGGLRIYTGRALQFDGDDDYVSIPGSDAYVFGEGGFTIEMWIRPHIIQGNWRVLFCDQTLDKCQLNLSSAGAIEFSNPTGGPMLATPPLQWELDNWYHVAVTRLNDTLSLLRNGVEYASMRCTLSVGDTTPLMVGHRTYFVPHPFSGSIGEVRLWNIGRSASEIAALYPCAVIPSTPGLVGYWNFGEDSLSQTVNDLSSSGNNGVLGANSSPGSDDPIRVTSTAPIVNCYFACGDANADNAIDISDAVYLIAYIFSGGPAPDPVAAGDANCDSAVDISDAVYLIGYIFGGGPAPCAGC